MAQVNDLIVSGAARFVQNVNVNGTIITPGRDSYGIRPATNNYGFVGTPIYYYYNGYITLIYTSGFYPKSGSSDINMKANFMPDSTGTFNVGSYSNPWNNVYGKTIHVVGGTVDLKPVSSSTDDSADLVFYYGNGREKSRIWTDNTYSSASGPSYRVYNSSGTSLYTGRLQTVSSSSRTVKKNIENMTDEEANKLFELRPVTFDYKEPGQGTDCVGLIAEEVKDVGIKSVLTENPVGPNTDEKIPALLYEMFVPYLIKVVQNQQKEINELKAKLNDI